MKVDRGSSERSSGCFRLLPALALGSGRVDGNGKMADGKQKSEAPSTGRRYADAQAFFAWKRYFPFVWKGKSEVNLQPSLSTQELSENN